VIETPRQAGFLSVGQPAARRIAMRAASDVATGTLLVHGPPGAGTEAFVEDVLAVHLCEAADPSARPCNACRGCRDARARTHPDLVAGSPEAWREARHTGESIVAAARRWLLEAAGAPIRAARRIVLVEGVDRAGEPIQNALLKALEEPGDRQRFILVAEEPANLLPTIRSRSRPLRIGPVSRAELTTYLMDAARLPRDLADSLAHLSNGLVGTALRLANDGDFVTWRRRVQGELIDLLGRGRADRFGSVRDLLEEATRRAVVTPERTGEDEDARVPASAQRAGAFLLVEVWLALTRDLLVVAAGRPELAPGSELGAGLDGYRGRIAVGDLVRMARLLERILDGLGENAAPRLALETAMLAWPSVPPTGDR
jgi:DNA polymerase III subunit delta'